MQWFLSSDEMAFPFMGEDHNTWGSWSEPNGFAKDGLVAVCPRCAMDHFSWTLAEKGVHLIHFFLRLFVKKEEGGSSSMWGFNDRQVEWFTWWLTGVIAAAGPAGAIYALMCAETWEGGLAVMVGNNLAMMVCLSLCTLAERQDSFVIVTLFTLVQAVFLGKTWA